MNVGNKRDSRGLFQSIQESIRTAGDRMSTTIDHDVPTRHLKMTSTSVKIGHPWRQNQLYLIREECQAWGRLSFPLLAEFFHPPPLDLGDRNHRQARQADQVPVRQQGVFLDS